MKIRISIDKKTALKAGRDQHGLRVVEVPAASLTPAQREVLARHDWDGGLRDAPPADFYLDQAAAHLSQGDERTRVAALMGAVEEPTSEAVVALLDGLVRVQQERDQRRRLQEQKEAEELRRKVAEALASDPESWIVRSPYNSFHDPETDTRTRKWELVETGRSLLNKPGMEAFRDDLNARLERRNEHTLRGEHALAVAAARVRIAEEEAEKARAQAEKRAWVEAHGSSHLRKALAAGHSCHQMYVRERAALEHPGFEVDLANEAEWKDRTCPSERALDLAAETPGAEVVWLTNPVGGEDVYGDDWEACEAVVLREYLGRYDLVRIVE